MRDGYEGRVSEALDAINAALRKPPGTVLHWAENVKTHPQRKHVVRELAALDVTISSVVVFKAPLMGSRSGLSDPAIIYNYAVRRLLERISWFVDDAGAEASVTFAHIKNFPYDRLRKYVELLRGSRTTVRWGAFAGNPKHDQPSRIRPLQVADLVAGAHSSAFREDAYGDYEPSYLLELAPRIYIREGGRVTSYGLNLIGPPDHITTYPWWPALEDACAARGARTGPA